jgi:regulatory protein
VGLNVAVHDRRDVEHMSHQDGEETKTLQDAVERARRLLARRGHAEQELRLKLEDREFGPELIDGAVDQLQAEGALDDSRFAEHQADLLQQQGWGPRRIRQKLRDRGVSDTDIESALAAVQEEDPDLWLRRCFERVRQKFGEPDPKWSQRDKAKVFRHLEHRGFERALIRRILFDGARPSGDNARGTDG